MLWTPTKENAGFHLQENLLCLHARCRQSARRRSETSRFAIGGTFLQLLSNATEEPSLWGLRLAKIPKKADDVTSEAQARRAVGGKQGQAAVERGSAAFAWTTAKAAIRRLMAALAVCKSLTPITRRLS